LKPASTALARVDECVGKLSEIAGDTGAAADAKFVDDFAAAKDDDLNVSAGWGVVFDWVREMNRLISADQVTSAQAAAAVAAWQQVDAVLGIGSKGEEEAPAKILALLEQREAARKARDFKRADALRDDLKAHGWLIEDTAKGPRLKRIST
jgi:cysteinyl-tRNA synthetase